MTLHCPQCQSQKIDTLNHGRKTGSAVGTVAGVAPDQPACEQDAVPARHHSKPAAQSGVGSDTG